MKNLFFAFILLSSTCYSQKLSIGPLVGFGANNTFNNIIDSEFYGGSLWGVDAIYRKNKNWRFGSRVIMNKKGFVDANTIVNSNYHNLYHLEYIEAPLQVSYIVPISEVAGIYTLLGLNNGWLIKSSKTETEFINGKYVHKTSDWTVTGAATNKYELGIKLGLGFDYQYFKTRGIRTELSFQYALTSVIGSTFASASNGPYMRNHCFSLSLIADLIKI